MSRVTTTLALITLIGLLTIILSGIQAAWTRQGNQPVTHERVLNPPMTVTRVMTVTITPSATTCVHCTWMEKRP